MMEPPVNGAKSPPDECTLLLTPLLFVPEIVVKSGVSSIDWQLETSSNILKLHLIFCLLPIRLFVACFLMALVAVTPLHLES